MKYFILGLLLILVLFSYFNNISNEKNFVASANSTEIYFENMPMDTFTSSYPPYFFFSYF